MPLYHAIRAPSFVIAKLAILLGWVSRYPYLKRNTPRDLHKKLPVRAFK